MSCLLDLGQSSLLGLLVVGRLSSWSGSSWAIGSWCRRSGLRLSSGGGLGLGSRRRLGGLRRGGRGIGGGGSSGRGLGRVLVLLLAAEDVLEDGLGLVNRIEGFAVELHVR